MNSEHPFEQTADFVRRALPLMSKYNISFTPKNYSIWYKYVSFDDEELIRTINTMIETGTPFSQETNADLYQQFCSGKVEQELQKVRGELQSILLNVMQEMGELAEKTDEYEHFLSNSVNVLSENAPVQNVRLAIEEIMEKTRTLGNSRIRIKDRLQETKLSLEVLKEQYSQAIAGESTDFVNGVVNKKAFDEALPLYVKEAKISRLPLALMLIDIDWFKRFNELYGYQIGDEILKFVAQQIKERVKAEDLVGRMGGDEFAVALTQTPFEDVWKLAEEIRTFFSKNTLKSKSSSRILGHITMSIGITVYRLGESLDAFIHGADQALSQAKNNGRNRVEGRSR
jgi:diguanylate cyclase